MPQSLQPYLIYQAMWREMVYLLLLSILIKKDSFDSLASLSSNGEKDYKRVCNDATYAIPLLPNNHSLPSRTTSRNSLVVSVAK